MVPADTVTGASGVSALAAVITVPIPKALTTKP
jgi:hypothetical protein